MVYRTYASIFSIIGWVDHSKACTLIYLQKIASCINLQLPIVVEKSYFREASSENVHNYVFQFSQKSGRYNQPKLCTQIYLQKRNLHKFATTNSNFLKVYYFSHASS